MPELQNPPVPAPESNLIPGMAAPEPGLAAQLAGSTTGGFPNIPDSSGPGLVALQEPGSWVYDFDPASGIGRATFNGNVRFTSGGSATAGVTSFNTRTGDVTLSLADVTGAGGAPLASPAMTGTPTVPTAAPGTATTQAASTAFVGAAIAANAGVVTFNGRGGAVTLTASDVVSAGGAPTVSPAFTGSPTAPSPIVSDNSSAIATTAYVNNYAAQNLVLSFNGRRGAVTLSLSDITSAGGAPITSPTFLGTPAAPTAAPGTSTTQLATTAFVENAVTAAASGVVSWNGRSGVVTMTLADVTSIGGAPLLSPALTGTPTAPTASAGTSTTQLATTAFVATAISDMAPVVSSFNGRTGTVTLQLTDVTSVGGAPLAAPVFTGNAASSTPTAGDNSTRIATTAFVTPAIASAIAPLATTAALANYLPLAGGTLTGNLTLSGSNALSVGGALTVGGNFTANGGGVTASAGTINAVNFAASGAVWCGGATPIGNAMSAPGMFADIFAGHGSGPPQPHFADGAGGDLWIGWGLNGPRHWPIITPDSGSISGAVSLATMTNALGLNLVSGGGGPIGVNLNLTDVAGTLYGINVDAGSDARIKENIAASEIDAVALLGQIPIQQFDIKAEIASFYANCGNLDGEPVSVPAQHVPLGIVAQDIEALIPEAVTIRDPGEHTPMPSDMRYLSPEAIVPYLVRAVQQLTERLQALEGAR